MYVRKVIRILCSSSWINVAKVEPLTVVGIQELCANGYFDTFSLLDQDSYNLGAINDADVSSVLSWLAVFQELIRSKVGASSTASNSFAVNEGLQ